MEKLVVLFVVVAPVETVDVLDTVPHPLKIPEIQRWSDRHRFVEFYRSN